MPPSRKPSTARRDEPRAAASDPAAACAPSTLPRGFATAHGGRIPVAAAVPAEYHSEMKILRAPPVHRGRTAEARLRPRIPRACGWLLAAAVALALPTAALAAEPGDAEFFESRV